MKNSYKIFMILLINFLLFCENANSETKKTRESSLTINLEGELKKGNLLIGIKQYLGDTNQKNFKSKNLLFESEDDFLYLNSGNGISHKSKSIEIRWERILLPKPLIVERLVLGPFASFESAKKQSDTLNFIGLKPKIVYPNNWELWLPINASLAKKYNFQPTKLVYKFENTPG